MEILIAALESLVLHHWVRVIIRVRIRVGVKVRVRVKGLGGSMIHLIDCIPYKALPIP